MLVLILAFESTILYGNVLQNSCISLSLLLFLVNIVKKELLHLKHNFVINLIL